MRYREIEGFKFLHVANAYLSAVPLETTFDGYPIKWNPALDLLYPEVADIEQSCYLVYKNDEVTPLYVGQYTGKFGGRWLRNGKYIWHGKHDDRIKDALKAGENISIWITVDPYTKLNDGRCVNINKTIEQIIIESVRPEWNTTGKIPAVRAGISVLEICNKYESNLQLLERKLVEKMKEMNLEDHHEKLVKNIERDSATNTYSQSWSGFQSGKLNLVSRIRHFIEYVSLGVAPEQALDFVWKEFP